MFASQTISILHKVLDHPDRPIHHPQLHLELIPQVILTAAMNYTITTHIWYKNHKSLPYNNKLHCYQRFIPKI